MNRITIFLAFFLFIQANFALAQVVTWEPVLVTAEDMITITFDAKEGNGELAGSGGPLYAHTGVITSESTSPSDWKYVVSDWGIANNKVLLTAIGDDKYQISYNIRSYYGVPSNEAILKLAFVFRNVDGSKVGRATDGGDIFIDVAQSTGLQATFAEPFERPYIAQLNESFTIAVQASEEATISIYIDNSLVSQNVGTQAVYEETVTEEAKKWVKYVASTNTEEVADSFFYLVQPSNTVASLPNEIEDGITYLNDNSVVLSLYAPSKKFVYVIGDFNDWELDNNYLMKVTPENDRYWLQIDGLEAGKEYAFQYLVDGFIKIGDPYAEKVLDPWNDQFITSDVYPNLKSYPAGKTTDIVSVLQTAQTPYTWTTTDYERPTQSNLVIYELLIRDFLGSHSYKDLTDTLDYLQRLGVNAIELMPIMEFEGNNSWGYNPSYFFAPDKYYGTEEDLKRFIDESHKRGIAVILDMVLNHAFGQCALVRLYPNLDESPYHNKVAKHPFNVGYDFNHESTATQYFVDRVNEYWLTEYKFDGYRFDLSKGFTQTDSGNDAGLFGQRDESRIAILKRMADKLWETDPTAYVILEHFADNSEEKELADYGMMLWGNVNHDYAEAAKGLSSNLTGISYKGRGFNSPHLVGYMESHDEERMMYRLVNNGNSNGSYNTRDFATAIERAKMATTFFLPIPGPKMVWEFGELGYDFSINRCTDGTINNNCRLSDKPIRWDYQDDANRSSLFDHYRLMIALKKNYPTFQTDNFNMEMASTFKVVRLRHAEMDAIIVGNFDVVQKTKLVTFTKFGTWYDFLTGEELEILDTFRDVTLAPGEFHIYTSAPLPSPADILMTSIEDHEVLTAKYQIRHFPNPFQQTATIEYALPKAANVSVRIFNVLGEEIEVLFEGKQNAGLQSLQWNASDFPNGTYFYQVDIEGERVSDRLLLLK
ncbi:MAG: alpha-amylase family glycosyl hydrolase [Chitinophagales bacterium]